MASVTVWHILSRLEDLNRSIHSVNRRIAEDAHAPSEERACDGKEVAEMVAEYQVRLEGIKQEAQKIVGIHKSAQGLIETSARVTSQNIEILRTTLPARITRGKELSALQGELDKVKIAYRQIHAKKEKFESIPNQDVRQLLGRVTDLMTDKRMTTREALVLVAMQTSLAKWTEPTLTDQYDDLIASLKEETPSTEAQTFFRETLAKMPDTIRAHIYRSIWDLSDKTSKDPEFGKNNLFANIPQLQRILLAAPGFPQVKVLELMKGILEKVEMYPNSGKPVIEAAVQAELQGLFDLLSQTNQEAIRTGIKDYSWNRTDDNPGLFADPRGLDHAVRGQIRELMPRDDMSYTLRELTNCWRLDRVETQLKREEQEAAQRRIDPRAAVVSRVDLEPGETNDGAIDFEDYWKNMATEEPGAAHPAPERSPKVQGLLALLEQINVIAVLDEEEERSAQIQALLKEKADASLSGSIYTAVWEKDGEPMGDPQYGEHHVGNHIAVVREKIMELIDPERGNF